MAGASDQRRLGARGDSAWDGASSHGGTSAGDSDELMYNHGVGVAGDVSETDVSGEEWDEEHGRVGEAYGASPEKEPMLGAFRGSGAAARDPADRARAGKKSSRSAGTAPVRSAPRKSAGWFGGWAGGGSPSSPSGSGSESKRETEESTKKRLELARRHAARESARRKAERRLYKPASFLLLGKLALMWTGLIVIVYACLFLAALACYANPYAVELSPTYEYIWAVLSCLALIGIPSMATHALGFALLPPVWGEAFPEREKVLEQLGGVLYFRFVHCRRLHRPGATKKAVEVAVEVLSRTLPNTLWEVEVVTDRDLFLNDACAVELPFPEHKKYTQVSWVVTDANKDAGSETHGPCELLAHATEASRAGWGDWVVHLGSDGILNQRAVDAVLAHAARESRLSALSSSRAPRARRLAQGSVMPGITRTANALEGGVPTMGSWAPALAEVVRAGEAAGATHLAYSRGAIGPALAASPGRLLVVPHEFERLVGWVSSRTPPGTEHTSFAMRCSHRGAQFAWLDAGVHVPVAPGGFAALFRRRAREHAALARLLFEESHDSLRDSHDAKNARSKTSSDLEEDNESGGSVGLNPVSQTVLATMCVSGAFAKLAPILCLAAPFARRATGPEATALAVGVGVVAAAQTFVYAVGFYVSSGARHLARGAPGYVLYLLLFAATLVLVPVFSLFELIAMVASPLFAATRRREKKTRSETRRESVSAHFQKDDRGSASSSDSMIGSDGEVRRWKGSTGGKSRRRGGAAGGAGSSTSPPSR
eukprot:CAMPEP_0203008822 /NCGR_PEP_ID=MMETSP1401-20130829/8394_1 /ASSEMBLY_ACC=CAM_ASM_000894 /TAXON_ID=38833 /ORGANISM="Micromonas pusilla, Strain CCAC1681" /LENGTH=768 /DNA_ID=CAMNT_0049750487 /DNA_START=26 /DNA_END=2329 /DNA_ORIENTATION=+